MFELTAFTRPERDLFRMMDAFDREFFGRPARPMVSTFRTDLSDTGDSYRLEAELPGFNKEDISISVDGDLLTIKAQQNAETEDNSRGYVYRERRMGSYSRSFDISGIEESAITAKYENGVLTLDLPKAQKPEKRCRNIELN